MKKIISLLMILGFSGNLIFGQNEVLKPAVQYPVYFDVSPPLRDMVKNQVLKADNSWKEESVKNYFNARHNPNKQVFAPNYIDPVIQNVNGMETVTDTTIQNFDGNTNTQGYYPPDTHGDVGPNHYFQITNCHYSIYSKTGALLLGPVSNSTIWSGMPNNSNGGDGVVVYDGQADRWLVAQLSYPNGSSTPPFLVMIAVSQTPDPTGSWYRYEYTYTQFPDYPKFGVWPDGYYMSINQFTTSGNWAGIGASAFNRTQMIAGNSTAQMVFFSLPNTNDAYSMLPSDCDGTFPTTGTPNYFTYMMDGPDYLGIYEFHVDWTTPANSTFGNFLQLTVNTFNDNLTGIPQKGTSHQVDPLSDRLMYRLQYRKFSDHQSMVCNHTVNTGSSIAGIRWYELRKTSGSWSVYQQSTYSPDNNCRWMGSCAMDSSGNIALGYSISSSTLYPSIRYTGRLNNDALNTMTIAERGIYNGGGSETGGGTPGRWGDYSSLTVDPSAPATFWYTQEYFSTNSSSNWKTRIGSFSFGNIFTVTASATPAYINIGQTSQLNVIATGGTGIYTYSWTSIPPGYTSNIQNPVVSPILTTQYVAHVTSGSQTLTDTTEVYINMTAIASANPYTINSGASSQLNVTATGGTGTYTYSWTSNPAGFTSNLQNPVVSPTVNTIYTAVVTSGTQNASDTAIVHVNLNVVATATPAVILIGQPSQLNAIVTGGSGSYTYSWTSIPPGFTSIIQNPVVYPTITTQYIVTVNDGTQTKADTTQVTVTYNPLVVNATATPSSICAGQTSQLNVVAGGGTLNYTYSWTSIPAGFYSNIQNPVVQPLITTIYIATVSDGLSNASDSTTVIVTPSPTATAGNDTTVCVYVGQVQLYGQSTNSSAVLWSTSGDGTFLNPATLNAIYYPGANDKIAGVVALTLNAWPILPCTNIVSSVKHLYFSPCTGIPEPGNEEFSVSLRPNPSEGMFNLVVTGLVPGDVRINILDISGNVIFRETLTSNKNRVNTKIDLSTFSKGIYFVKVATDKQVETEKLIME